MWRTRASCAVNVSAPSSGIAGSITSLIEFLVCHVFSLKMSVHIDIKIKNIHLHHGEHGGHGEEN
jgi:hypothetical protein